MTREVDGASSAPTPPADRRRSRAQADYSRRRAGQNSRERHDRPVCRRRGDPRVRELRQPVPVHPAGSVVLVGLPGAGPDGASSAPRSPPTTGTRCPRTLRRAFVSRWPTRWPADPSRPPGISPTPPGCTSSSVTAEHASCATLPAPRSTMSMVTASTLPTCGCCAMLPSQGQPVP